MSDDDDRRYTVVRNDEEQYSLWPAARPTPPGWTDVGVSGTKPECLDFIRREWTDLRPKSLRTWMGG